MYTKALYFNLQSSSQIWNSLEQIHIPSCPYLYWHKPLHFFPLIVLLPQLSDLNLSLNIFLYNERRLIKNLFRAISSISSEDYDTIF